MFKKLLLFMFLSGSSALMLEMVWLRRLSLQLGSAGLSATITLAIYMGGLGVGAWIGGKRRWMHPIRSYGLLELFVGFWALIFPWGLQILSPTFEGNSAWSLVVSVPLLLPPALAHGATLPALSGVLKEAEDTGLLYAMNTLGAVIGVLGAAFLFLPTVGVRGTECLAMLLCISIALLAIRNTHQIGLFIDGELGHISWKVSSAVALVGFASMSLEVIWSRLGALLMGGSVYAFAVVLAVFLLGIAYGAQQGRRREAGDFPIAVAMMGLLSLLGIFAWRWLPHGLAISWSIFGDGSILPTGALLLGLSMAGAPIASGMVFSLALKQGHGDMPFKTAGVLLANTVGSVLGVLSTGPLLMPHLGIVRTTVLLSGICVGTMVFYAWSDSRIRWIAAVSLSLGLLVPSWDVAIYSTGLYNRIGEFVDLSPRAIEQFAHGGWEPRYYVDGHSATIAVGQSTKSQNLWLSINGKVDASTGADMPTQVLSGQLPLTIHQKSNAVETLVVGLASGVTANESLRNGAEPLVVVELEPSIVTAAKFFHSVNEGLVDNPRASIRIADARAVLQNENREYDVIISEPSNPWITGVSNLFTVEYWELGRKRLRKDGVFCQWVQLYALPPEGMRSLIASFLSVYPNTWLFETIPGSDALLISAPMLPDNLPIEPTLGPLELQRLADGARLNTDDMPWIEFEAPKWVNRPTGRMNRELIEYAVDTTMAR